MDTNFKKVENKIVRMDKEIVNVKEVLVEVQETTSAKQIDNFSSEMGATSRQRQFKVGEIHDEDSNDQCSRTQIVVTLILGAALRNI
jgi:23S rRNA C2498 (ribose-2'-O)-methylase RlmM